MILLSKLPIGSKMKNSYQIHMKKWCLGGIQTLTERRKRGDLIQAFKWFNNIDRIQSDNKPSYNSDKRTRGHSKRYRRELVKTCNSRFNFLLNRVEKDWNNLPVKAVLAPSTSSFKAQIDSFFGWP